MRFGLMRFASRFISTRQLVTVSLLLTIVVSSLSLQGNASAITEWKIPLDGPDPRWEPKGIAVSSGGLVYFADVYVATLGGSDYIGRLDPSSGVFTLWNLGSTPEPYGVAVGDGYVYFVETEGNRIGRLDPSSGEIVKWTIPTVNSYASWLVFSNGLIYFQESPRNKIGRLDPSSGQFTEWTVPTPDSRPIALVVSGNVVYFAEYDGNKIGRLEPSSDKFTEWTIPTSSSKPYSIAVQDGLVYFTEQQKIGSLDPTSGIFTEWVVGIDPSRMVAYDGVLYFTSQAHNSICRFSPSTGEFAEWIIPTTSSLPYDIAVSSGIVYFTESSGHKIGRLDFNPVKSTTLTSSRTRSSFTTTSAVSTASGTFISSTAQAPYATTTQSVTGVSETSSTQFADTLTYFVDPARTAAVGGEIFSTDKFAVLAPYLALIGVVAVASIIIKRKLMRRY